MLRLFLVLILGASLFSNRAEAVVDPGFVPCDAGGTSCDGPWKEGDYGYHIVRMQMRLYEYRYYNFQINGYFDAATAKAIRAFQRNKGLAADSVVGPRTKEALNHPITLRGGARGEPVANLQERLNQLGYGVLSVDGEFGPNTQYALAEFQKRNGISPDAVLGDSTRKILESSEAVHASRDFKLKPWNRGFNVPITLVNALVRQESGGKLRVVSRAGALGKYQIMPGTARKWGCAAGYCWLRKAKYRDLRRALFNPDIAEAIARTYINYYWAKYRRYELVLVAYNGGPKRAEQAAWCFRKHGTICTYRRETYHYVKNIMRMAGLERAKVTYIR